MIIVTTIFFNELCTRVYCTSAVAFITIALIRISNRIIRCGSLDEIKEQFAGFGRLIVQWRCKGQSPEKISTSRYMTVKAAKQVTRSLKEKIEQFLATKSTCQRQW